MKTCKTCLKQFQATTEFFYERKSTKLDGLSNDCRKCYCATEKKRYKNREGVKRPPKRNPDRLQKEIWCSVCTKLVAAACSISGFKISATVDHILSGNIVMCSSYQKSGHRKRVHLSVDNERFEDAKANYTLMHGIPVSNEDIVNILLLSLISNDKK